MRIGLIVGPWFTVPPEKYGGTERVVDALARALTDAGHDVLLAASSDSTCPVPQLDGLGPSRPGELGETLSELSHVIRSYAGMRGMDIIHDHTLAGPLYAHRWPDIPVVTTIHGPLTAQSAELYRAMAGDTAIVAISHNQGSMVPGLPVSAVIHHGLDLSTVSMGNGAGGYACFVGRMCPDKGLMEAVGIAREAGIPLRIAAKMHAKDEQRFYQEVVKPALGPQEEFLGELADPEKYQLMGDAAVLINPIQWHEPFGLVMIEALATGTPVIATPMGAAPEIIQHGKTGFLGDVHQLAGFVDAATKLSRADCRRAVEGYFSAGRMAAEHLELYARVIEQFKGKGVTGGPYVKENQRQAF
ncbi:glycosyltransferase family 4 protein [Paenarthrobacter ureafaciens]|jgi:glycosyltransferase involved in cell wall biosynthesis|uniref:glycosyltransferase family 4 protein n=1 Tax=Paenarthrobacter ureafaciens TaxID=37931 RepID=UPI00140A4B0F|nr:glycosyltransferase family 4 protein [Paenarthrobacter ureafaciens]MCX8454762.1 glycosyltransferase family 4 protein [Paenarthrobacter ureafaciens]MCY0973568.1 glycosyltransferase family 4 protein [Paenarthrobacter ureafaciens]UOD81891.1 glycosyltransferase family 4 protein [Paenarthrobacter ureafaciens]WNZ05382.1 glycosyltransferase family 4 protein [Paenarthrobacter ureafaciens]